MTVDDKGKGRRIPVTSRQPPDPGADGDPSPAFGTQTEEIVAEATAEVSPEQTVAELEREIADLKAQLAEKQDAFLRAVAELENYKRRTSKDLQERTQFANERLLSALLPALDNCERAMESLQSTRDVDAVLQGVELLTRQLHSVLAGFGLQEAPAEGRHFDPKLHEAIATVSTQDHQDGTIIHVERKGYALHGRTLRPAQVVVAHTPQAAADDESGSPE